MFSLPQPSSATPPSVSTSGAYTDDLKDGLPVVPFTEDSHTLNALLGILYPGKGERCMDISTIAKALAAADKYCLFGVIRQMEPFLSQVRVIEEGPMRVYILARRFDMPELAKRAAKETLLHPFPGPYSRELKDTSAAALYDLLEYRDKCVKLLDPLLEDPTSNVWESTQVQRWHFNQSVNTRAFSSWCAVCGWAKVTRFTEYKALIRQKYTSMLCGASIKSINVWDTCIKHFHLCKECMWSYAPQLVEFNEKLAAILDAQIAEVSSPNCYHVAESE